MSTLWNAGGVNLRKARIREGGPLAVRAPDGGRVAALGVRTQVEDVPVPAGRQNHGMTRVGADLSGDEVAHDNAPGVAVDNDHVEHLGPREHPHIAARDLLLEGLIGSQQKLLARLPARVEGARNLRATKRPIRQEAAVLPCKRHTLRDALVDDLHGDLGQPVDVRLARPEVAALDGVVEQAPDAVAVVLVVLGGVDATLRGDAVGTAGRVLKAEARDLVAKLRQRRRRRSAREPRTHDEHVIFPFVGRVHELHLEPMPVPLVVERPAGNSRVEFHAPNGLAWSWPAANPAEQHCHRHGGEAEPQGDGENGRERP